jgi:micrococcal nuclease
MRLLPVLAIIAVVSPAHAADMPDTFTCALDHVTDGDTIKVFCPNWPLPFQHTALRVFGVDTPESRKPAAKCVKEIRLSLIAKSWLKQQFQSATDVTFTWAHTTDKYGGRIDATVLLPNGKDVATELVRIGLARRYDGGKKSNWCK